LPHARLYAWAYSRTARTVVEGAAGGEGRFRFGPLAATPTQVFWCEAPGYARLRVGERDAPVVAVLPGADLDVGDIVLGPDIAATGTLLDPDGAPVPAAQVSASIYYHQLGRTITENGPKSQVLTAVDGTFRIGSLSPGDLHVEISVPGYPRVRTGTAITSSDSSVQLPPLQLSRAQTAVSGRVTDGMGNPVVGARVGAYGDDEVFATTDAAGRFHFVARAESVLHATVSHPECDQHSIQPVKDPTDVRLTFDVPRWIDGSVRDEATKQLVAIVDLNVCEVMRDLDGGESLAG
jgi:hypothetical protein